MKKVIVTGATGFIGHWVVRELLTHGIEVIAIVRKNSKNFDKLSSEKVRVVSCNLDQICELGNLISDKDIDTVYHFGWQGVSDEDIKNADVQISNVKATLDLINVLPQVGCNTFIGAGSLHEIEGHYDMLEDKVVTNLGYMYKAAKISAHWMGKALAGSKNIRFFWPIISNTYGVGEKSKRLINTVIREIFLGKTPALSAGKQNYDFVYISDVARAFYLIGEKGVDGTNYFIGSGQMKPLNVYMEVVGEIANEIAHSYVELGFGNKTSDVVYLPEKVFSIENLCRDTGFKAMVPFEEGIRETAKWIWENM